MIIRRDQDYRGTHTTVDWSRLVHMVRQGKPGALEVLQDAIEYYFPEQFAEARQTAETHARWTREEWLVGFNSRRARRRFLPRPRGIARVHSPFWEYSVRQILEAGPPANTALVWSSRSGPNPPRDLMRRARGIREARERS